VCSLGPKSPKSRKKRMPRCCDPAADDFAPCYASVLVAGKDGLRAAVENLEQCAPICPCVTAWCPACRRVAALTYTRGSFLTSSAHLAHALVVHANVERTLAEHRRLLAVSSTKFLPRGAAI
jgi:hypothetical protein